MCLHLVFIYNKSTEHILFQMLFRYNKLHDIRKNVEYSLKAYLNQWIFLTWWSISKYASLALVQLLYMVAIWLYSESHKLFFFQKTDARDSYVCTIIPFYSANGTKLYLALQVQAQHLSSTIQQCLCSSVKRYYKLYLGSASFAE